MRVQTIQIQLTKPTLAAFAGTPTKPSADNPQPAAVNMNIVNERREMVFLVFGIMDRTGGRQKMALGELIKLAVEDEHESNRPQAAIIEPPESILMGRLQRRLKGQEVANGQAKKSGTLPVSPSEMDSDELALVTRFQRPPLPAPYIPKFTSPHTRAILKQRSLIALDDTLPAEIRCLAREWWDAHQSLLKLSRSKDGKDKAALAEYLNAAGDQIGVSLQGGQPLFTFHTFGILRQAKLLDENGKLPPGYKTLALAWEFNNASAQLKRQTKVFTLKGVQKQHPPADRPSKPPLDSSPKTKPPLAKKVWKLFGRRS